MPAAVENRRRRRHVDLSGTRREAGLHSKKQNDDQDRPTSTKIKTGPDYFHRWRPGVTLLFMLACIAAALIADNVLPEPRPADPAITPLSEFSADRAHKHLESILSFGIRTVGSEANEVLTPSYISNFATKLQKSPGTDKVDIEVSIQHPSGSFSHWFLGGFTNVYRNVTNVVVRLSGNHHPRTKQNALLVSAHFDTALGTVAAGDDAAMIAAMMELLSNLAHQEEPLEHAVIFVFNGAEETNWQAAHGFITQHPWASSVRAVINLEGAGSGGRAMVVQTGPRHSWIAQVFGKVAARPHAYTLAQEIFSSRVIPGWTDYETYIEYSDNEVAGIDMLFLKNGYVYHTSIDDLAHVTPGTLQHVGENLLPTVRSMANSRFLVDSLDFKDKTAVYFDIWGLFLIILPDASLAHSIYCGLAFVIVFIDFRLFSQRLTHELSGSLFAWLASVVQVIAFQISVTLGGIAASLLVGVFFALLTSQSMAWFSHFHIACLLFGLASFFGVIVARIMCTGLLPDEVRSTKFGLFFGSQADRGALLCNVVGMLVLTFMGINSAYIFAVPVFVTFAGSISQLVMGSLCKSSISFPVCTTLASVVVFSLNCEMFVALSCFFVPITGRLGGVVQTDILISVLLGVTAAFILSLPTAALHGKSTKATFKIVRPLLYATTLTVLLLIAYLFSQHPYSKEAPKRLYIVQTKRKFYGKLSVSKEPSKAVKSDNGLWVIPFDIRGLTPDIEDLRIPELAAEGRKIASCDTDAVYCGYPWYFPIQEMIGPTSWYVPLSNSQALSPVHPTLSLQLLSKERGSLPNSQKLTFRGVGPTHMTLVFEGKLLGWSLTNTPLPNSSTSCVSAMKASEKTECRWAFFSTGSGNPALGQGVWDFWLEIPHDDQDNADSATPERSRLRIAFYGHYGLDREYEGTSVTSVASQLPDWVALVSWASEWHQYEV